MNLTKNKQVKKERLKKSKKQIMGQLLIFMGLLLIVVTFGQNLYASWENRREVEVFQEAYGRPQETKKPSEEKPEVPATLSSDRIQEDEVIAVLRIPAIECEEVVKEGSGRWTLAKALGHMEGTAFPGEAGNCAIAGHRNYNFGLYFNRLNEVKIEDEILIQTKDAVYTYKVFNIEVVEPEEVSVLEPTEEPTLTLITCTPIYIATHRLIVQGELVKSEVQTP